MNWNKLVALGLSLMLIVSVNYQLYACSCQSITVKQAYDNAHLVFSGKVMNVGYVVDPQKTFDKPVAQMSVQEKYENGIFEQEVTLKIRCKTLKGTVEDKLVKVRTGIGGGDCGVFFKEGEQYIVYAFEDEKGQPFYRTTTCATTKAYDKQEYRALKKLKRGNS